MSNELLFYSDVPILFGNNPVITQIPGFDNYKIIARHFDLNSSLHDRTNTIKFPLKMKSSPVPEFDKNFNLTYKECAAKRMEELDKIHKQTGKKFRLLYSGGVDSSGMFAAFVNYYGVTKTRDLLEICCSKESIDENPWLWDKYIRKENFNILLSHDHSYQWNDNKIVIMGEGNDQLFGKRSDYSYYVANKKLTCDITVEEIKNYFDYKFKHPQNEHLATVLINLLTSAPFVINNMFTFLWWCNFVLAWGGVNSRVLSQAVQDKLPADTLASGLIQFYNATEFQQWSMNYHCNFDLNHGPIFKHACKEMIINSLDIPEYKNKHKTMSWPKLHSLRPTAYLIDTDLNLYRNVEDYLKFIQPDNSFV